MCTGLGLGPRQAGVGELPGQSPQTHLLLAETSGPTHQERPASWSLEAWVSYNMVVQTAQSERKAEGGARAPLTANVH